MPRPRFVSISIRTPWARLPGGGVVLPILRVGRDIAGAPMGGLPRARPCPCALLAKTVRLTMRSHGALTPIYYGKFPLPPATAGATHTLTFALFTDPRKRLSAS